MASENLKKFKENGAQGIKVDDDKSGDSVATQCHPQKQLPLSLIVQKELLDKSPFPPGFAPKSQNLNKRNSGEEEDCQDKSVPYSDKDDKLRGARKLKPQKRRRIIYKDGQVHSEGEIFQGSPSSMVDSVKDTELVRTDDSAMRREDCKEVSRTSDQEKMGNEVSHAVQEGVCATSGKAPDSLEALASELEARIGRLEKLFAILKTGRYDGRNI